MKISDLFSRFENNLVVLRGLQPSTVGRYITHIKQFELWFVSRGVEGGADPLAVDQSHIEEWLKHLYFKQGNQNPTRAAKLAALKKFFQFLVYDRLIEQHSNPAVNIPTPKFSKTMPQVFATGPLQDIFFAPDERSTRGIRDKAILTVLYGTGPRVNEIRNLNLADIQFSGSGAYLHYKKTKGVKERVVRLGEVEPLRRWLTIREAHINAGDPDAGASVFVSLNMGSKPGTRLSTVSFNNILKHYAALVGIKNERVFVHKMRATMATDLYDAGVGLIEISYMLGHESVDTTQRYIARSETALKKTSITRKRWNELKRRDDG